MSEVTVLEDVELKVPQTRFFAFGPGGVQIDDCSDGVSRQTLNVLGRGLTMALGSGVCTL